MTDYKIVLTAPGRGEVYRDGELMHGVTGVSVRASVGGPTTVEIEMLADRVDIEVSGEIFEVESRG